MTHHDHENLVDLKDKKILYLLLENARMPASAIARHVKLSKNAVPYRILRLVEREVIWKFCPIINYRKLGMQACDIFIKLHTNARRESEIKDYFKSHSNLVSASRLFGKFDYFLQIIVKDFADFEKIWEEIVDFLGDDLDYYEAKLVTKQIKIDYQMFHDTKINYKYKPVAVDYSRIARLDKLDKKIISYLNEVSAIAKFQDVGKSAGASLETTRNHINKLIADGVITRFVPFVKHKKIGLAQFLIMINFKHFTNEVETEVARFIRNSDNIRLAFKTLAKPEVYFWAAAPGHFVMQELLAGLKSRFYDLILSAEIMPITEDITLNLFPRALRDL